MRKKTRTLVSFDWAAKNILRDKANFDILEGFLTTLLKQEIKVKSILESESTREYESDKYNKVDLLVEDEAGKLIVVEIQNNREVHYLERMLYGASRLIVDHLQLGESYSQVKKVISISILYFLLGEGENDYVYHGTTDFYGLNDQQKLELKPHHKNALIRNVNANGHIFPEYYLIEVERFQDIIKSDLDEWIYFFKNSEIKENFRAKNIQHIPEKLNLLKMSEAERKAYEKYLMNKASERGVIQAAREDGEAEGMKKGMEEIATAMLENGEPIEKIKQYTRLSETVIKALKSRDRK